MRGRSLLIAVVLLGAACSAAPDAASPSASSTGSSAPSTSTTTAPPATSTTTAPPATSATTSPEPTTSGTTGTSEPRESLLYDAWRGSEEFVDGLELDVHAPETVDAWPVVVTIHGGGWYGGRRDSMGLLADGLAARGVVVFNITYSTAIRGGQYPGAVDDVACGLSYAAANASRFTTTPDRIYLVGHSAGAHLGALVTFDSGSYGAPCTDRLPPISGFVGLAGPYDISLLEFVLTPWIGADRQTEPELWTRANPLTHADDAPVIPYLLVHGDADQVVPVSFSEQLRDALELAGRDVNYRLIAGAGHGEVNDPRVVGDLIADFVDLSTG